MLAEPHGHRGHPTGTETARASRLKPRLGAAVAALQAHGFSEADAVAFIAGAAWEAGQAVLGETWTKPYQAKQTIERVLYEDRAAKMWSIGAIHHAINVIQEAM